MGFKSDIATAAQDVSVRSGYGAYTGELSAQLLVDSGITWALTGHSERRDGFNAPVCLNPLERLLISTGREQRTCWSKNKECS
jgi:triosephosphate isomerase